MQKIARKTANNASFQAFMNCYLREIDPGVWHSQLDWGLETGVNFDNHETYILELQLKPLDITLAIGVNFRSLVGRHRLTTIYQQPLNQFDWQQIDSLTAIQLLIDNIYSENSKAISIKPHKLELLARTIESHQVMSDYLEQRFDDSRLHSRRFIDSEQSLLFGHWLHPTPKSRQGIHAWQHQNYTPELCGQFQLHFFAVDRHLVNQNSILETSTEHIMQQIAVMGPATDSLADVIDNHLNNGMVVLPVHPLQAQWLLHQNYIIELQQQGSITDIGQLGPYFTPTSSVRTVYCEELEYMIKLSIPVKITNSMRINMQHELDAGMLIARLLRTCGFSEQYPQFTTIDDPAYITLNLPDRQESGFEVIVRENPFFQSRAKQPTLSVQSIAAIVQDPLLPDSPSRLALMVHQLAAQENRSISNVSLSWFEAYWDCAIEPAIRLYDTYGIALEAHQQNSLLDVSKGYPKRYYYRDNQGFYLSNHLRKDLLALEPELNRIEDLFYDDEMIRNRFSYYLIINQLFSVINRFGLDGLINEERLLESAYEKLLRLLPQLRSVGTALVQSILYQRDIPCKGNLLTRVEDVDELQVELELAVYTHIKNPIYYISQQAMQATPATASHYINSGVLRESA